MDWEGDGTGSFLHLPQRGLGNRSVGRIDEHGYPNRFGLQLEQYPKPLGHDLLEEIIDAGRVATWPGEVGNKTKFHGVFADAEDDRNRICRSLSRERSGRGGRGDYGDATTDQISHQCRKYVVSAL
jgi:hypothetical protein